MGKVMARFKTRVSRLSRPAGPFSASRSFSCSSLKSGLRFTFAVRDRMSAPESPDRRILSEGYGGATWPIEHYREIESLEERWQPYVYFRPKSFHGKTIVIGPDGLRATWQPAGAGGDEGEQEGGQDTHAGRIVALGLRRARRPDDPLAAGAQTSRTRAEGRDQEPCGTRIRQHPGSDRTHPRASGRLPPGRGDLLRRRQRHHLSPVIRRGRLDDE